MQYAFLIVLLASIVIALRWGASPERWGAVTLVVMTVLQILGMSALGARFGMIDWVALVVDLLGFCSFTAIALFARRIWPLWASAFQLFSLMAHFVRHVDIHVHPAVYWLMKSAPTFGVCLIVIGASVLHRCRAKADGLDTSWMDWSSRKRPGRSTPTIHRS